MFCILPQQFFLDVTFSPLLPQQLWNRSLQHATHLVTLTMIHHCLSSCTVQEPNFFLSIWFERWLYFNSKLTLLMVCGLNNPNTRDVQIVLIIGKIRFNSNFKSCMGNCTNFFLYNFLEGSKEILPLKKQKIPLVCLRELRFVEYLSAPSQKYIDLRHPISFCCELRLWEVSNILIYTSPTNF